MSTVSESLIKLIKSSPLSASTLRGKDVAEIIQNLNFDSLELLAQLYASEATYNNPDYWHVWREIENELNPPFSKFSFDKLSCRSSMSYAHWALANGNGSEAIEVYRYCLELKDKEDYLNWSHSLKFLDYYLQNQSYAEVVKIVDQFVQTGDETPAQQIRAVKAEIALGKIEAAQQRLEQACYRWHYSANLWATAALFFYQYGDQKRADQALQECIKYLFDTEELDLHKYHLLDSEYEAALKQTFKINDAQWSELKQPYLWPSWDFDEEYQLFRSSDGAVIKPSEAPTPHWFGGEDFLLPKCPCGYPKRQWFLLNISAIEGLQRRLPNWHLFPLLGCAECCAWLGRHDYQVDPEKLVIKLDIVGCFSSWTRDIEEEPIATIPKQYIKLVSFREYATASDDEFEYFTRGKPTVGGLPDWTQSPLRIYCHLCHQEMIFVAGMQSPCDFIPYIPINNESGYQYHFACNDCHTISVIAQNT